MPAVRPEAVLRESFGRREFLRRGGGGLLLMMGGALPGCTGARSEGDVLSKAELETLRVLCLRLLPGGDGAPSATDLDVAGRIVDLLPLLGPPALTDFRRLLSLLEWSPVLFDARPSRFTTLTAELQDETVRSWAGSRFGFRRRGFVALKRLAMSIYYAQEGSWRSIGFPGPWVQV